MSQERRPQRPDGAGGPGFMGRGGPMAGMGMPVEKAKDFKGTLKRLLGYFVPQKYRLLAVLITAVIGTVFNIVGPKILGLATTKLFEGLILKFRHVPGAAVDFTYIRNILLILLGLYVISAVFTYIQQYIMAGVAQRMVYTLRQQIEDKIERLPLKFFDSRTHGEILSRAVNDMDNISNTLQQSLTQLITSAVTLIGVIILMLTISPLLSLVIVLTFPLSILV
ncbi:MAG: ABC transporter ATP-binding protein, partial [Ktedonobacteraceae bacterium]|nr:ABC transporter ATP-binding protein [Ktedonobacteraceae bacterium]